MATADRLSKLRDASLRAKRKRHSIKRKKEKAPVLEAGGGQRARTCRAGMFAILRRVQVAAAGDAVFGGGATAGFVNAADSGAALTSALEASAGGGQMGLSDSAFASKLIVSPALVAKETQKAKQGYCETALWNCNDLYGPG